MLQGLFSMKETPKNNVPFVDLRILFFRRKINKI